MKDAEPDTRPRRRAPWLIALGVCAAVLLLAVAIVAQRRAIARSLINAQLRALGLEEVGHSVDRFGFSEFGVRDLRIGGAGDLSVERIDARYSPSSLMAGRLEELVVRGVRLRGTIDPAGISFGALDPLLQRETGEGAGPASTAALPAANIAIEDVAVELETPQGPLAASFAAQARDAGGGYIAASASFAAQLAGFDGAGRIEAHGTPEAFEGAASLELTARGAIGPGAELEPATLALIAGFVYADERMDFALAPAPFAITVHRGDETFRVEGETPALALARTPTPNGRAPAIRVLSVGGRLGLPDLDVEARNIAVDADLDPETGLPSGSLRIGALADTRATPRIHELAIDGKFEAAATNLRFDVTAADPGRQLVLTVAGSHDIATSSGEARVGLQPVVFRAGGLQPAALSPLLGEWLEAASGSVTAQGAIAWGGDRAIRGGLDLVVQGLSASSALASFECLTAGIRVDGPWPLSTPPEQQIYMTRVDFGLELINGVVSFQIRPDGILDVASAEWSFAGGTARARGQVDLDAETQEFVLELADIDMSELLALVDIDGLTGSGRLEGRIPLTRQGQVLEIRGGKLSAAKGGGWIRYRPNAGIAGAASPEAELGVAFAVLENLHYDELGATLDGDAAGPVTIAFHISGTNPDYLAGHPVEFNPVFESRLVDLLQKVTAVYQIPASIEKKVQAMSQATPEDTRLSPPSGEECRPALDADRRAR